jgi:polyphosphate kinase 2 (PPK2 family)
MSIVNGSVREALRVQPGTVNLAGYETAATPLAPGKKDKTLEAAAGTGPLLATEQERLWAEGTRSLLLVLQGTDTAGKGGVVTHVVGLLGPMGVKITAFKKPTEDVLVPRVHDLVPEAEWRRRYEEINTFEAELVANGTAVVKCFLHLSYAEQRERLLARLDDPTKHWKFHESDIDERAYWSDYQAAYAGMLEHCSTEVAPWYVVPSDRKWYRNWAIGQILREDFEELDPQYPQSDLDVPRLRKRLEPPY